MNIKIDNKKIVLITIGIVALVMGLFGVTYAWFSVRVPEPNGSSMDIVAADLGTINFVDGPEIALEEIYPDTSEYKTFTITRTEAADETEIFYNIVLYVRSNTLTAVADGEFVYGLYGVETGTERVLAVDFGQVVPETTSILSTSSFVGNGEHTYQFEITLNETGSNQNSTRGMGFNGYLQVEMAEFDSPGGGPTSPNCFLVDAGIIEYYMDYEYGNSSYPECPKDVIIPDSISETPINSIKEMAFMSKGLTSVTIPSSIVSIGYAAFNDNELSNSEAFIYARTDTNSDDVAEIDNTKLVSYGGSSRADVVIPNTVETIDMAAFGLNYLTSVTIPTSVTTIADFAFNTNSLTSVTIPTSVTTIGMTAFGENPLTSVTIPSSVMSIGDLSFSPTLLSAVCIKGKSSYLDFTSYGGDIWGWDTGYDDSYITWDCTN